MKSLCLLSVGFSSQYDKKHSKNKTIKFALALSYNFAQCHLGTYSADRSGGFWLQFSCALQFAGEGVGTCSRQNLHYTGYAEKGTQRIVDSQGVSVHPCLWHSFFLFLVFNFFSIFNMIISNFIFKMTLRRLRNVVTFRVDFYYKRWICWTISKIYLVWWCA